MAGKFPFGNKQQTKEDDAKETARMNAISKRLANMEKNKKKK